jgi:TRAP-type mannitol/chloroaromatic compound transport system substrate-binding protein
VTIERRRFMINAAATTGAVAAGAIFDVPAVIAQPKVQWRLSTAWPPSLDMLQGAAQRLAKVVEKMTGGRFRIEVFPAGQIMQALECFDAASRGTIEAFHGPSYYWPEKEPAVQWFSTVSFGMDPAGIDSLVLPGRWAPSMGRSVCRLQPRAAPRPGNCPADGGMVQKEDQYDR